MDPVQAKNIKQIVRSISDQSTQTQNPVSSKQSEKFQSLLKDKIDVASDPSLKKVDGQQISNASTLKKSLMELNTRQYEIQKVADDILNGKKFSSREMIAIQAKLLQYNQEMQTVSKVVEQLVNGIKTTMQTQV